MCLAVAQSKEAATAAPAPAAQPQTPAYELPSWSRFPQPISDTSTTLQQLWLKCPDSFSTLLTPQRSHPHASHNPSHTLAANHSESSGSRPFPSNALTQLSGQLQQHVQMMACGSAAASVSMLDDLISFLQA